MAETFFDSRYGDLPLRGFDSDGLVEQDIALITTMQQHLS